jgi:CRISPR-associated protein Csx14
MALSEVPVDLANPGQVFACLGLMEAAETLIGGASATFAWTGVALAATFRLAVAGDDAPVPHVLRFLAEAEVVSVAPAGSGFSTAKWDVQTETSATELAGGWAVDAYPAPLPDSPATLVARLRDGRGRVLVVDHWADATRDTVKFWAGSGGYPGVGLMRDAIALFRNGAGQAAADPFAVMAPQSSSFRFDWRRDYIPLDAGFSPNDQASIVMGGFPIVEVLAAIGLGNARPARPDRRNKLRYRYGVLAAGEPVEPIFLRAALGGSLALPGAELRQFEMRLAWPGQENQARAIVDVTEIEGPSE